MAANSHTAHDDTNNVSNNLNNTGTHAQDYEKVTGGMSHEERDAAHRAARFGYGPLAHMRTDGTAMLPAFGGEFQPGLYRPVEGRKFANPAPLGLCGFALTTFVLSCINVGVKDLYGIPNVVVAPAFAYGGLCQLLAGMWEMAVGNTFGATALSSYGGFWIALAIIFTPGGFEIESSIIAAGTADALLNSVGIFLIGWFIFTFILLICTLKSTVAFFLLFFTLDMAFLLLAVGYLQHGPAGPNEGCNKAGGYFGFFAAFLAWYNALAGIADTSNSFFIVPVIHFPWSEKGKAMRNKTEHTA